MVHAAVPSEYELKAAYVFNILRFVELRAARPAGEYLTLGTFSAGPIEQALRGLEGSPVHGRRLRVRTVTGDADLRGCDVVFFGRSNGAVPQMLVRARSAGILTIGNDDSFLPAGGLITLVVDAHRIVIVIDKSATTSDRWSICSHLLELARLVREQRK